MSKKTSKKNKPNSKNLKINTRIAITSVLTIVIPLLIIAIFSTVFLSSISTFFNFSTVTTSSYSIINQLQWGQTLSTVSSDLIDESSSDEQKYNNVKSFISPIEAQGADFYITKNDSVFYQTQDGIVLEAEKIVSINNEDNICYFGNDGLVIQNKSIDSDNNTYRILVVSKEFIVNDLTQRTTTGEFISIFVGESGMIVIAAVLIFIAAIAVLSFFTSKTIIKPIKKISQGANEIARGNLDYEIKYDSTNELGQTVDSFNAMRTRLKASLEEQEKATQERNELIAGIAHDLRTPLTSIKGYVEGLIDGIADTPEKRDKYLKVIYSSTVDTQKILDDLLAISNLELNNIVLNKEKINIMQYTKEISQEIKIYLEENDFDFDLRVNCKNDSCVMLDVNRFSRVLDNILSNCLKYKKDDVKGKVYFALDEYDRNVILEISDNGIGVDEKSLTKIFDVMYRADPARTKVSNGSGLGLAISKQIIQLHGGSMWASSKNQNGLSIFISIPKGETDG